MPLKTEVCTFRAYVVTGDPGGAAFSAVPLYALTMLLLNLHPTEAAAERSFSSQKQVHRPLRASLSHENVESEVFLRWNLQAYLENQRALV